MHAIHIDQSITISEFNFWYPKVLIHCGCISNRHMICSHSVFEYTGCNMNIKSFYGRNSILVTTLEEANAIVEAADHVLSVVVLPPDSGDSQSHDTDDEDTNHDNRDSIFEPTGQLEVGEEAGESDDESSQGKCRRLDSRWLHEHSTNTYATEW